MTDLTPPSGLPPEHPAPQDSWKPLSGLAVTAFVLSLVMILFALAGLWVAQLVPLLLGGLTLMTVEAGKKRGRILAVWAIVIALSMGSCSFMLHQGMRGLWSDTTEAILSVLSSKSADEEKTKSLRMWAWPQALEKDDALPAKWMERYAGVVAKYGKWQESFELPSILGGSWPLLTAPKDVVEIGSEDTKPPDWALGAVIWTPAVFENGLVHVAIVLQTGDQDAAKALPELRPGEEIAIVGDVRFFRAKAEKQP